MAPRLLLCLLLACVALPAAARQAAMMDANGAGGGCHHAADAETDAETVRAGDKRAVVPKRGTRPATSRGDSDTTVRPPRWHSFLPGMIR